MEGKTPYVIGAVIGVYVIYRIVNGHSTSAPVSSGTIMPVPYATTGAGSANQAALEIAQGQVNAQNIAATGQAAAQIGAAVAQVSGGRMAYDANAINAASADNQATIQSMALESVGGMNAVSSAIGAAGNASAAVGNSTANQIAAMGQMYQGAGQMLLAGAANNDVLIKDNSYATINAINSMGQLQTLNTQALNNALNTQAKNAKYATGYAATSSASTGQAAAQIGTANANAAAAASNANAQSSGGMWNAIGGVATTAAMVML